MFHTSYSIPRFDPSIKRWLKSQISNMVKKFQNIKYNPGLVTLQRNENWVAYEARKETVEERASEGGPFERRERTQKANTVTDAEGNCWVANRNMKCRNVERRAKKTQQREGRKYFCFTPTETNGSISFSPPYRFQTVALGSPLHICSKIG